jgi:hypothetical protein
MRKVSWVILACVAVAVVIASITAAAIGLWTASVPPIKTGGGDFTLTATAAQPGILTVKGAAKVPSTAHDRRIWWMVELRQTQGRELVTKFTKEYDQQVVSVPAGQTANPTFSEQYEREPGNYNVLLRLCDDTPIAGPDGVPLSPRKHGRATNQWVTVK